jgi:signal transduction histidine kinase
MRTSLEVAMAKPGPVPPQFVTLAERLGRELGHVDRLLESFLTLAHTQQGPPADQATVSLDNLARLAIESHTNAISTMQLTVEHQQCPDARVTGSRTLLSRMVENVIHNAVRHNRPGGWVRVTTTVTDKRGQLVVENGGPVLDPDQVKGLTDPFRRIGAERTGQDNGAGMGLAIVASIVDVHGGELDLAARSGGGLRVAITLPLAAVTAAGATA